MQEIWNDHHRQLKEIDRRYKKRILVLKLFAILIFVAFIIICTNNSYI
jgi:hypothetical protein